MKKKEKYWRNLPHIQPVGGLFFVTYHVRGSLPMQVLEAWAAQYELQKFQIKQSEETDKEIQLAQLREEYFRKFDKYLDEQGDRHYFKNDELAQVVSDSLRFWDRKRIELICYCIMSNHVHAIFQLFEKNEIGDPVYLDEILKSIKQFSVKACNKLLKKNGRFWQEESYDRLIRDADDLSRVIAYILDNSLKAGLCENRSDWKWSYINEEYNEFL